MAYATVPSRAGRLPSESLAGLATLASASSAEHEFPRASHWMQAGTLQPEIYTGATQRAGSFLAQAVPRRNTASRGSSSGASAAAAPEAPWWRSEPMKVHLNLDRFDQGSDESTHLGEPGSVGSNSPRDDGASEKSLAVGDTEGIAATKATTETGLPSRGAVLHRSGHCKPCAWFWKAQGCSNGSECNHCHLCPMGELKRRKQEKVAKMQASQAMEQESTSHVQPSVLSGNASNDGPTVPVSEPESPWTVPLAATVGFSLPALLQALKLEEAVAAATTGAQLLDPLAQAPVRHGAVEFVLDAPPGLDGLTSKGAALHASGNCRPCAWFWKPQGCANGRDCRHCHACPFGELKTRKQYKVAALREAGQGTTPATTDVMLTGAVDSVDQRIPVQPLKPGPLAGPPGLASPLATRVRATALPWPGALLGARGGAGVGVVPPPPPPPPAALPTWAPHQSAPAGTLEVSKPHQQFSAGAVVHGAGVCQPCAWFWKPQGCANGEECSRCHLCPDGEVRRRRKAKISAMKQDAQRPSILEERLRPSLLEEQMLLPLALLE
eukprot:CAMPEP_0171249648 /NCGR_PEP_ID=MMETSP0790-20130122/49655_1 /TAXON_ID=2925 /ORGANISM="Alexandrium catenella, Strain OF101" /LENGTH=552 /DNA_ID=CAMNT_0011717167 /DNA_START=60 /DNA_END=1718 /DNA_ORIENTATION=-